MSDKITHIGQLKPDQRNPRRHSPRNIGVVVDSLRQVGFARSIVIDEGGTILAGNGVTEAAGIAGIERVIEVEADGKTIVAVRRRGLSDEQKQALKYYDNRSGELADWDPAVVVSDLELGLDLSGLWSPDELSVTLEGAADSLLGGDGNPTQDEEVDQTEAEKYQAIWQVKPGDVWQLGDHRIACLDSLDEEAVKAVIGGDSVGMVWADPPYGIRAASSYADGKLRKRGLAPNVPRSKFVDIPGDDNTETAREAAGLYLGLYSGALHIWWGANHYSESIPSSSCWIVWDKENCEGMDFADGEMAWSNSKTAIRIFKHRWQGMLKASEQGQRRVHPTQKPAALARWCFEKYGKPNDLIIDPFLGSGISVLAAEALGDRRVIGFELAVEYIATTIQRWHDLTGRDPILLSE